MKESFAPTSGCTPRFTGSSCNAADVEMPTTRCTLHKITDRVRVLHVVLHLGRRELHSACAHPWMEYAHCKTSLGDSENLHSSSLSIQFPFTF